MKSFNATKIQRWWKKRTTLSSLKKVHNLLTLHLGNETKQELSNKCDAIKKACKGDGVGLSSGSLIDMLMSEILEVNVPGFMPNHEGESDFSFSNQPYSFKKISGGSSLALSWSKNDKLKKPVKPNKPNRSKKTKKDKDVSLFSCPIFILNLTPEQWWKTKPKLRPLLNITYNEFIPSGLYLVDVPFCKHVIKLSTNNKTDTLIGKEFVYLMLKRSMMLNLFISLPTPSKALRFNINLAFSEVKYESKIEPSSGVVEVKFSKRSKKINSVQTGIGTKF
jgi:hypothetical protein